LNRKHYALPAAVVFLLCTASLFSGRIASAQSKPQQDGGQRGIALNNDAKAKVASELNGHYFALVIGINNYQHLPKLTTAAPDARALAALLHDQYGFQTTVLVDASRDQITKALNDYRHNLDENASLLIYYAGHGIYDKEADKAYWLPVDADRDDTSHWIMADEITTEVKVIPARHVLIISDSCYSGGMTREIAPAFTQQDRERFLEKMVLGKSRTLMSSGALEPVSDIGGNGHSAFTGALLQALTATSDSVFSAGGVFDQYIQVSVAGRSEQTPQYVPVRNSGHDYGDFVFVRSGKAPPPSPVAKNDRPQPPVSRIAPTEPAAPPAAPARRVDAPNRALYDSLAGEYDFGAIVDDISVNTDGALTSLLPGQPSYELEPTGDLQFNVKGAPGFSAEFHREANGAVTELVSHQPTGSITGQRRSGEKLDRAVLQSLAGNYAYGALTVNVAMPRDGELTYFVPGQPLYSLRFTHGLHFVIAGVLGVSIEFRRGANGEVTGLVAHMPTGDTSFLRKK
jgi:uncharacterized caspase-like protein